MLCCVEDVLDDADLFGHIFTKEITARAEFHFPQSVVPSERLRRPLVLNS